MYRHNFYIICDDADVSTILIYCHNQDWCMKNREIMKNINTEIKLLNMCVCARARASVRFLRITSLCLYHFFVTKFTLESRKQN